MPLPPLPVVIPFLTAAFLAATRDLIHSRTANRIAIAAALATTGICAALFVEAGRDRIVYWFGGWEPRNGIAIGISFVIDRIGAGIATLAAFLVVCAFVFSSRYFDTLRALYHVLMLSFLGAMCGFSLTGDLFNLFVFFELMSAAGFALCGYKTEEPGPLQGALNFAVTNTIGGFLALSGIALLYGRTGALNMAQIGRVLGGRPDALVAVAFLMIAVGFFVKGAIVPFHFWLADAHAVAPTPVCILFSGIMVELGLYAVMRVYWTVFAGALGGRSAELRNILLAAGILTAIAGGVMCLAQRHLKRLLAFSTISHMGLMLIGFALLVPGGLAGTAIYIAGHAFVKASLFVCAGILLHRFRSIDEFDLRGRGRLRQPGAIITGCVFVLSGLGLAGMPPFGTFLGDTLVDDAARRLGYGWLWTVFVAAEIMTAGAVLRAAGRVFLGWGSDPAMERDRAGRIEEEPETHGGHRRIPASMLVPAAGLMVLGILLGLAPHARDLAGVAAAEFQDRAGYSGRVLEGVRQALPHFEPARSMVAGIVRGFLTAIGAAALAIVILFRRSLAHAGNRALAPLRALHSGEIGDYVAWLTFGLAGFGACFIAFLR